MRKEFGSAGEGRLYWMDMCLVVCVHALQERCSPGQTRVVSRKADMQTGKKDSFAQHVRARTFSRDNTT